MDHIYKRVQVFLHYCNTITIEYVELGALKKVWGHPEEGGEREVVDIGNRMGGSDSTKGGRTTEIRRAWDYSKAERRGRWKRRSVSTTE